MNYSLAQAGNVTALAGILVTILNYYGYTILQTELEAIIGAIVVIVGIIISWVGRYRKGDLTVAGFRK